MIIEGVLEAARKRDREISLFRTYDGEEDGEKKWGLLFIVFESYVIEINRDIN